jgi:hypothetical protein
MTVVAEVVRLREIAIEARILTNPATRVFHGDAMSSQE